MIQPDEKLPPVEQDISGWVVMPQSHFDALMKAIPEKKTSSERSWFTNHYIYAAAYSSYPPSITNIAVRTMALMGIKQ